MKYLILEFVYYTVLLSLLSSAFLNFLYKDSNESLLLFAGSLCIVFSEVIQYAFFYVSEETILNVMCYALLVFGFLFFYIYAIQGKSKDMQRISMSSRL
ncbi:hypothetical protein [Formosa haliotis]|uniref:hypothetical protein n=1 Tax=Formosa haliotis TaxID=1555194 RepID=UPI0011465B59|nr:hypothetical protein [Formosa haliotis]